MTAMAFAADKPDWSMLSLDVSGCHRLEIVTALKAGEAASGLNAPPTALPWTWPAEARDAMRRELERWIDANPTRRIVAVSYGISDHKTPNLVLIVHSMGNSSEDNPNGKV